MLGKRRLGGDPARGRRRGRRRGRADHRLGRRLCFVTTDAQLLHFGADARPAPGPLRRRHRRRPARRRRAGRLVRRARPGRARGLGRRHRLRLVHGAARHRARRGQGRRRSRSTPPRAAPPAACAATGSSRARTPWSSPGPVRRRRGRPRPAARRSTCPAADRPARRLRRARQPADRGLRRAGRGPRRVCKADAVLTRNRAASALAAAALTVLSLVRLQRRLALRRRRRRRPTEVLAAAKTTLDETSGVHLTLATDDLPDGVTGVGRPTASAPTRRPSRARSPSCSSGQAVRGAGDRRRRQGLRPAPAHDRLAGHRPGRVRRPRPGPADEPRRRLLLAAPGDHRRRGGRERPRRRGQQARCSPSTPAPSAATSCRTSSRPPPATSTRRTRSPTTASCASATLTGVFYADSESMTYTVDLRRLRHREGHHRAVTRSPRLLLGLAAVAVAFAAADTYVVVLALPDMMASAGIPVDQLQRAAPIVSGFLLGYVAMLPLIGRIADLRGRVPVLVAALVVFALGSLVTDARLRPADAWSPAASSRASAAAGWCPPRSRWSPTSTPSSAAASRSASSPRSRSSAASSARCSARWCSPSPTGGRSS